MIDSYCQSDLTESPCIQIVCTQISKFRMLPLDAKAIKVLHMKADIKYLAEEQIFAFLSCFWTNICFYLVSEQIFAFLSCFWTNICISILFLEIQINSWPLYHLAASSRGSTLIFDSEKTLYIHCTMHTFLITILN